jgi:glutamate racemase
MDSSVPIGIFDSGIGGLSVWREVARQIPNEDTIYVADQAHVPYGSRSVEEVQRFSKDITQFLLDNGSQVIVVACNTASGAALSYLRTVFPGVTFVGMEPAVKPAVAHTRSGIVGVIATTGTLHADRFSNLVERFAGDVRVLTQTCPGLVEAVESGRLDTPETEALLRTCLQPLIEAGIDQLVLGCTHYPFLDSVIARVIGDGITLIDPAPAVARQTERVIQRSSRERRGQHVFYTTGNLKRFIVTLEGLVDVSIGDRFRCRAVRWHDRWLVVQE